MSDTKTTTTTTTSLKEELVVDSGYRSTLGKPKKPINLVQLFLVAACVGVVDYYMEKGYTTYNEITPKILYPLVGVAFLIGIISSFCLLLANIFLNHGSMKSITLFKVTSNGLALSILMFFLALVMTAMLQVNHMKCRYGQSYEPYLSPGAMGLLSSGLFIFYVFCVNRNGTRDLNTTDTIYGLYVLKICIHKKNLNLFKTNNNNENK